MSMLMLSLLNFYYNYILYIFFTNKVITLSTFLLGFIIVNALGDKFTHSVNGVKGQ